MSDTGITRAASTGALRRASRGLYQVLADTPGGEEPPAEARARFAAHVAAALSPGVVVSHQTAARLWGLPVPEGDGCHVQVPHGGHHRSLPRGFVVHQTRCPAGEIVAGVPVTPLARTVIDVARSEDLSVGVPVVDAALRSGSVTAAELEHELGRRQVGNVRARRVIGLSDGRAESRLESLLRLTLTLAGVPPVGVQHVVREAGRFIARVDLWYPGVVVEADGFEFHSAREDYRRDRRKGQAYARLGLLVLRFTWEDVVGSPEYVVATVRTAVARVAAR